MKIDISQFRRDSSFYGELNLLLTVKSFDLQAIRKRYLASKKNNRVGSVERRKVALGGIVSVSLKNGHHSGISTTQRKILVSSPNQMDVPKAHTLDMQVSMISSMDFITILDL